MKFVQVNKPQNRGQYSGHRNISKMLLQQRSTLICSFIFLTSLRMVTSGNAKYVRRGEPIQLISYSDISNCTEVFLYINGEKNLTLIGLWKLEMCTKEELHMNPEYEGRIAIDRYRNIWILKVDESVGAKYHIKCDNQNNTLEVELNVTSVLTDQDQIQKCQLDAMCVKNCLGINISTTVLTTLTEVTEEASHHTTVRLTEGTCPCFSNHMIIAILVIEVGIAVTVAVVFLFHKCGYFQFKKKNFQGEETVSLIESGQPQREHFVSDVNKPNFSLLSSFPGKTENNKNEAWLLDVVLNPDHDLIVTDGQNFELKKFSLQGQLKSKLSFKSRPHCLALTDGHCVTITFPFESVLRVIDTRGEMSVVSTIPFRSQCAGIGSMKDGRLIISNRESRSVYVCSKNGEILQEIKNDSTEETLFSKPAYVRVVDNTTFYVSDDRTQEVFVIRLEAGNTFTVKKQKKVTDPRTSCVVYDLLLVAASNINVFTLDGKEAGEVVLDGVQHVRGLAFSEDKQLLAITHRSDQGEKISVYQVKKH